MKPSERDNLEAHVDLCEQRYSDLYRRMSRVEYWLAGIALLLLIGEGTVADLVKRLFGS